MTCTRRHTLVTGASSGIGRATALGLAAAGHHVYAGVRAAADKVARDAERAIAAFPAQGRALYEDTFTAMLAVMMRREKHRSSPDVAAATVARALTAGHPRPLYRTGRYARRLALLSRLPTPVLDAARRRIFGLPPGSLVSS